jgi:hypothetical protein
MSKTGEPEEPGEVNALVRRLQRSSARTSSWEQARVGRGVRLRTKTLDPGIRRTQRVGKRMGVLSLSTASPSTAQRV